MPSGDGQPRTYSIANDTPGGVVNFAILLNEIEAEGAITTAVRSGANGGWLSTVGDAMHIWFADTLSGGEITALDGVVAAHQGALVIQAFQYLADESTQTTTQETWQSALSDTTAPLLNGIYFVSYNIDLRVDPFISLASASVSRISLDSTVISEVYHHGAAWGMYSGWTRVIVNEGQTVDVDVDWRRDPGLGGGDTAEVKNIRIGFARIGPQPQA